MAGSGFRGYKTKSAKLIGKKNVADKYSTLDRAIKTIIGSENVQIFTTLATNTLVLDSSNNVARWNPLNYSNANCYLTKSGNTPTYDTTYKLGKFGGVRSVSNQGLIQNANEDSASFNKTFITYMRQNIRGQIGSTELLLSHFWSVSPSAGTSKISTNNNSNFRYDNNFVTVATTLRTVTANTFASVLLPISSSVFRVYESRILANRTGSQAIYDSNKSLIVAGTGYTSTLTTNNSSYTFSPSSNASATTNADWDLNFANGFPASKFQAITNSPDALLYTLIYVPSTLTATQIQRAKLFLDKLYGV